MLPTLSRAGLALLAATCLCGAETQLRVDGSSTVYPISAAMAQAYAQEYPGLAVDVRFSGSTGGLRLLTSGEVPLVGASRPIKPSELATAAARGIEIIELPVAFDGLTVTVNRSNTFLYDISVDELKRLWESNSTVRVWRDLRPSWPDKPVALFGPGKDSGTFDYFTEVIIGKTHGARHDVTESEDDTDLVQGVVANDYALGYFGWAYYLESSAMLRAVAISTDGAPVKPTHESILDGSYLPLSRPLFLYVNKAALARSEVRHFVEFYLKNVASVVEQVGYVPLGERAYQLGRQRFQDRRTGSIFTGRKGRIDVTAVLLADEPMAQASKPSEPPVASGSLASAAPAVVRPVAGTAFTVQVDDLRDACLQLSQRALSDRTTVQELRELTADLENRLQALGNTFGSGVSLGGR